MISETKIKSFKGLFSIRLIATFAAFFAVFLFLITNSPFVSAESSVCTVELSGGQTLGNQSCPLNGDNPRVIMKTDWRRDCGVDNCDNGTYILSQGQDYDIKLEVTGLPGESFGVDWFVLPAGQTTKTERTDLRDKFSFSMPKVTTQLTLFPEVKKIGPGTTRTPVVLTAHSGMIIGQHQEEVAHPPAGDGSGIGDFITKIIVLLLYAIAGMLYGAFTLFILPIIEFLLSMQVHKFEFAAVILQPWAVIRNLMNVFFMLALLAVSMATLFRLGEKWNYRQILVKLVIMALLINFSLSIAQVILGIAQSFQNQFIPADGNAIKLLGRELLIGPYENLVQNFGSDANIAGVATLVNAFVFFFFGLTAFMTFIAIAALLIVRIVYLWLLLMTSPIAYAAYVLPSTAKYSSQWWSTFLKYAFLTPLLGLVLQICAVVAISQATYINNLPKSGLSAATSTVYGVLSSTITIVCLFAGMKAVTQGIAFAPQILGATQGWAKKKGWQAVSLSKSGVRIQKDRLKRNVQNQAALDLANDKKGFGGGYARTRGKIGAIATGGLGTYYNARISEPGKRKNAEAQKRADAAARRYAVLASTGGTIDTKEHTKAFGKIDDENMERYNEMSKKDLLETYQKLKNSEFGKSPEGKAQMRALLKSALGSGKIDHLVEKEKKKQGGLTEKNVHAFLEESLADDPQAQLFKESLNGAAKKKGKTIYVGHNKGTEAERNKERTDWIAGLDDDKEISTVSVKGLNMQDNEDVLKQAFDKVGTLDSVGRTQAVDLSLSAGSFDNESGRLVFKSKEKAEDFRRLRETNEEVALRLYNKMIGVSRATDKGWQPTIPEGYILEQEKEGADGKTTKEYQEVIAETGADGRVSYKKGSASSDDLKKNLRSAGQTLRAVELARKGGKARQEKKQSKSSVADDVPSVEGFQPGSNRREEEDADNDGVNVTEVEGLQTGSNRREDEDADDDDDDVATPEPSPEENTTT